MAPADQKLGEPVSDATGDATSDATAPCPEQQTVAEPQTASRSSSFVLVSGPAQPPPDRSWLLGAVVVFGLLLWPLVMVWWVLGKLLSFYLYAHCLLSWLLLLGLYALACTQSYSSPADWWRYELCPYSFSRSLLIILPVNAAVAGCIALLRCTVASPNSDRPAAGLPSLWSSQPWVVGALAAALGGGAALGQGLAYTGRMAQCWVVAVLTVSAGLNLCQVVALSRCWRPTSRASLLEAERQLVESAVAPVEGWTAYNAAGVHTIDVPAAAEPRLAAAVVLVHGFGAGAACWFNNLQALAQTGRRVLAIDWLGCGASDRPDFPSQPSVSEAEAWFVEAIERWRAELGLDRMVLVGHSLGAVLAASYAIAHSDRVDHLVLVSPATPRAPAPDRPGPHRVPPSAATLG